MQGFGEEEVLYLSVMPQQTQGSHLQSDEDGCIEQDTRYLLPDGHYRIRKE